MTKKNLTIEELKQIVSESVNKVLSELVYADANKVDRKKKTIGLTYTTGNRGEGNALAADKLVTDKMDAANGDTYEVMLKGNIPSYNITDIKGTEVMHYFKRLFDHQKTMAMVSNKKHNLEKEEYELQMKQEELDKFMAAFKKKIEFVLRYWVKKNKLQDTEFRAISIYPVPSSSNFNIEMAKRLSDIEVFGLPVQVIDPSLLVKDLRNLQVDKEFIEKNKKYYDSPVKKNGEDAESFGTIGQKVDDAIAKQNALKAVDNIVVKLNQTIDKIIPIYYETNRNKGLSEKRFQSLVNFYKSYYDTLALVSKITYYKSSVNKTVGVYRKSAISQIPYTKGPSVERRSGEIWNLVKDVLSGQICPINGKPYSEEPIYKWKKVPFEIKKLTNPERMGLRNIFNVNDKEMDMVQKELKRIKGTIFVIFDDNISGGATLGDICYQCKDLGIENIVPITFGKMPVKNTERGLILPTPINDKGEEGFNF